VELESQAAAATGDKQMAALLRERPAEAAELDTEIQFAIARCKDAGDINKVLDALDTLDKTVVEVFWRELDNKAHVAMSFVSSSWVGELEKSSPDWNRSIGVLERISAAALVYNAESVFAHAECARAILVREYLQDQDSTLAAEILTEAAERLGHTHPALQDYRAKLCLLDKKYEEAIEEWQNTPPPDETEDINTRLFTHREVIVCAARLGRWEMAAEFASQGLEAAHRLTYVDDTTAVGFIAERAFALWKAGQSAESLVVFVGLLDSLAGLPDTNSHIRSYTLHVAIANALRWLEQNSEYGANQIEPQPGDFTLHTVDEAFRTKPIPSYASYWFHLARLEYKWTTGNSILRRFEAEATKLGTPEITFQLEHLHVLHSLRDPTLESLVEAGARFADSVEAFSTVLPSKPSAVPKSQIIITLLFAGVVTSCGRNSISSIPVARWRSDVTTAGLLDENLASWLDLLERCVGASQEELLEILTDLHQSFDVRATAALFLSCERDVDIESFFFANSILLNAVHAYSFWRPATEPFIEAIMSNGWMEVVAKQRFAIRASARSIPQITAACQDTSASGLKKAAQIFLAAQNAVSYSLPAELVAKLRSLSNEWETVTETPNEGSESAGHPVGRN